MKKKCKKSLPPEAHKVTKKPRSSISKHCEATLVSLENRIHKMVLAVDTEDCRSGGNGQDVGMADDESQVRCSCPAVPEDMTILHGILTGQGYKYGYTAASPRRYHLRSCRLQIQNQRFHHNHHTSSQSRAPSHEAISRLRSTCRERNK